MLRRKNCWDNARVKGSCATVIWEVIRFHKYGARDFARVEIFLYLEVFYNPKLCRFTVGYGPPATFEARVGVA